MEVAVEVTIGKVPVDVEATGVEGGSTGMILLSVSLPNFRLSQFFDMSGQN